MEWKYSKLKNINMEDFLPSGQHPTRPSHEEFKKLSQRTTGETYNFVFINGELDTTLSSLDVIPKNLKAQKSSRSFADTNTDKFSQAHQGIGSWELVLDKESSLDKPVKVLFFNSQSVEGKALLIQPSLFIKIGDRGNLKLMIETVGGENHHYFLNSRVAFEVGAFASLQFLQTSEESSQSQHLTRYALTAGPGSQIVSLLEVLESGSGRFEVQMPLNHKEIKNEFYAVGLLKGKNHLDIETLIDHQVGESSTTQICKIIADDESKAVFAGTIKIARDAQKTQVQQLNQNILLSSKAEIDSEPQLQIDADDVKAAHGSTVGGLDPQEIFYLQSRAIPKQKALQILGFGFLNELSHRLEDDVLRHQAQERLKAHFQGGI